MAVLGLLALFLGTTAFAEEGEKKEELGFRERMTVRMLKDRLGLSDDQVGQLEKVLLESKKSTDSKIQELLTDEQKESYKKMQSEGGMGGMMGRMGRMGRGGRGGERGGRGGGMGGFRFGGPGGITGQLDQVLEQMKTRLKMTEGQTERVQEILSEIGEEATSKFMEKLPEYMGEGRPDWRRMMRDMSKEMNKYIDQAEKRIKKVLKEDQHEEFGKMMTEFREQINRMAGMADRGGRERFGRGRGNRLDRIMEDISGSPEEKAIIRDKVEAILNAQNEWTDKIRSARRELNDFVEKGESSSDDIQAKLLALRELEAQSKKAIDALREELVPILSFEQEAKLVIHRVLE
jgi:hypothetical protein